MTTKTIVLKKLLTCSNKLNEEDKQNNQFSKGDGKAYHFTHGLEVETKP